MEKDHFFKEPCEPMLYFILVVWLFSHEHSAVCSFCSLSQKIEGTVSAVVSGISGATSEISADEYKPSD
jgi:hypothetical protein